MGIHAINTDNLPEYKETIWTRIFEWWYDIWRYSWAYNLYYKTRNRLFKKYYLIDTRLPRTEWYDTECKMLYGNMALMMDYIEGEDPFERINWDWNEEHKAAKEEILTIKAWWENYDNRQKEIDNALTAWCDSKFGENCENMLEKINEPNSGEKISPSDRLHELEQKLRDETDEMLCRLIKVRHYLWT